VLHEGLAILLERSGFDVEGHGGHAEERLSLVPQPGPALVVMDIRTPPAQATEAWTQHC
jgi:DNA-binding NarL/FixJ family response regulator